MKVTFKTLLQEAFTLELDPQTTIEKVKDVIKKTRGHDPLIQIIIYAGKILGDEDTIEKVKFQEKDFMVLMISKPKPVKQEPVVEKIKEPEQPPAEVVDKAYGPSILTTGVEYEKAIGNLMEMGFSKEQVVLAMRAAFNNPDRAAEYLVSGVPSHIQENMTPVVSPEAQSEPAQQNPLLLGTSGAPINIFEAARRLQSSNPDASLDSVTAEARGQLAQLTNSAQFQQIRQLLESDPQMVQSILGYLGQMSPGLLQLLNRGDQEQLFRLLEEGLQNPAGQEGGAGNQWSGYDQSVISMTTEENEAVERLAALGFEKSLAIEAFFACDKNEELAANYLFNLGQGLN